MAKMKIFVSWSGPRSAAVAEALKEYLPMINNAFDPWLSSQDIPKGSRSTAEIAEALVAAKAGIICLTPTNLTAPWILYEAGGIAKTVDRPLACTLLIGLEPSDVGKPLGDFQHTRIKEKELLQLMKTLNAAAGDNARQASEIEKAFKLCWPELKEKLDNLPPEGPAGTPKRSDRELLEELVDEVRMGNAVIEKLMSISDLRFQRTVDTLTDHARRTQALVELQLERIHSLAAANGVQGVEQLGADERKVIERLSTEMRKRISSRHTALLAAKGRVAMREEKSRKS